MLPEEDKHLFDSLSSTARLTLEAMRYFAPAIVGPGDITRFAQWAGTSSINPEALNAAFGELQALKFAVRVDAGWQLTSAARRTQSIG